MTEADIQRWLAAAKLTDAERYAYEERVAICTAEGIPEARAHEIARQQVRPTPPKQMHLLDMPSDLYVRMMRQYDW